MNIRKQNLLKMLFTLLLTFILLVTTLGTNPFMNQLKAQEEETNEVQDQPNEKTEENSQEEENTQDLDEAQGKENTQQENTDQEIKQEPTEQDNQENEEFTEEDKEIDETLDKEDIKEDALNKDNELEKEEIQKEEKSIDKQNELLKSPTRGDNDEKPLVTEGVIFDNDIEYNTYFRFPDVKVENATEYTISRDFIRQFTRESVSLVIPYGQDPTIQVDYGIIGTLNGFNIILSATLSEFVPYDKNLTAYNTSSFDYDELDSILDEQEDIDKDSITKQYPVTSDPIGDDKRPMYPNGPTEMYICIGNDPRIGFYTLNIESYRLKFDIRYKDGHSLDDSIITFYSLNSRANETIVKNTEGKTFNISMATATTLDGKTVNYLLSIPRYYYPRAGTTGARQVESIKPINHTKTSVTKDSNLFLKPYNLFSVGDSTIDHNYKETTSDQTITRTYSADIGTDGWYFAYGDYTKLDYIYNPLTGVYDKINPDIALTTFYPDSRNMETYVGSISGGIWETSNIVAKSIRRDLTIKKEANTTSDKDFYFKVKIWRDVETEEIDFDVEELEGKAYAVLDSDTGTLTFFRDEAGKYTDKQTIGNKTYYTGFEEYDPPNPNTPNNPSWYNKRISVKKVVFQDVIRPLNLCNWFGGMSNLTSVENLKKLRTYLVKEAMSVFDGCTSLTELDTSEFYFPNARRLGAMFMNCSNLTYLDLSKMSFLSWVTLPGQAGLESGAAQIFSGCSKLSTEVTFPVMPKNYSNTFLNAATAPGAEIKFKVYAVSEYQKNQLINTKQNPNSKITFAGYVEHNDIFPEVPDYLTENSSHKFNQIIFDMTDDERFAYEFKTNEYFFSLKAGDSITIEDIPKGFHYEIHELDSWKGNPLEEKDIIDDSNWTFYSAENSVGVIENDNITSTFTNKAPGTLEIKKETFNDEEGTFKFRVKAWKDTYEYLHEVGKRHPKKEHSTFGDSHEIEFYDYVDIEGTVFKVFNVEGNAIITDENTNPSGPADEYHVLDDSHHHVYHDLHFVEAINPLQSVVDYGIETLLELEATYHGEKLYQDVSSEPHHYHVGENYPDMLHEATLYTHLVFDEEVDDEKYTLIKQNETYFDFSSADMDPVVDEDHDGIADDGVYEFTLKNGDVTDVYLIPYDYKFEVWEQLEGKWVLLSVDEDKSKTKVTGIITSVEPNKHTFLNAGKHKLTISKEVVADQIDTDKEFEFTITSFVELDNDKLTLKDKIVEDDKTTYVYEFALKHNEKIEIENLLYKTEYTIKEKADEEYDTYVDGDEGYVAEVTILDDTEVKYVNEKIKYYHVTYRYEGDLPAKVLETLPEDTNDYRSGKTIDAQDPSADMIDIDNYTYTFLGWDEDSKEIIDKDIEFVGKWKVEERIEPSYKVTYEYEGDNLPKDVMDTLPTDDNDYPANTHITAKNPSDMEVEVEDGIWIFDSWDEQKKTIIDKDIKFIGTWKFVSKYKVTYEYQGDNLPQDVLDTLPVDEQRYFANTEIEAKDPSDTTVEVEDGTWTFVSWDADKKTIIDSDIKFIGIWKFEKREDPTFKVFYEYKGDNLPKDVMDTLPVDDKQYTAGTNITAKEPSEIEIETQDGMWLFIEWDKQQQTILDADIKFIGTWKFVKKEDPTFKVIYKYEGSLPQEVLNTLPVDKNKYPANTLVVAKNPSNTSIKVSDGTWIFIGWDKSEDTIVDSDITFIGKWRFLKDRKDSGEYTIPKTGI